ncbi:Serine/threonine-protein kinase mTOR [Lamellibrachia satsuma]|nr:Serine/threonine-protein kinase mTOR [Lamellibrachia satsuma]
MCIDKARDILDTELTAMVGESYSRAYGAMVNVQMLSELEEVIQYKLVQDRRETIQTMWWDRLQGCQRVVEDWQRILQVRSLVVTPQEDMKTWLKYASLCRKTRRLALSNKTLVMLLAPPCHLRYLKHMYKTNRKNEALHHMQIFVQHSLHPQAAQLVSSDNVQQRMETDQLLARCYLKLGDWYENTQGLSEASIPQVLQYYHTATQHDKTWYKACILPASSTARRLNICHMPYQTATVPL